MSRPIAPCKDCDFRELGCHSTCELYKDYDLANNKYKADRREALKKEYGSIDYVQILKNRKKKNK